ncbi:bifunctional UDP-N-acetylmuramoyl-tripeptide:D-alanyl-D-alanine ligase/alanine racemase [Dysgonomonas sp. GY617]|uniref:bifunctional UDP-N-acetylmuramoyl-tripeptide:D-alanyl-D-alanine ligase/alanine racemase n=1 Tax=Dysgonomonas sp. GY617 TaxID=2780420 RepID=UPI001883219F|nr:bifunctional UDP-N-acetylmuramoyl-tripeptide:D-alanyl-D-alanine ligase/alanine racemase [Dysgonomonas sp. GY617]MBF0576477.1 bifunctional UDP-N-acetylmuramoyl-tripeptide:D-alanyl-D-alanine ligase/alanine racemase [Dysgonomonas sp. GY617]
MIYTISEIAKTLKIKEVNNPESPISHLLSDSREVFNPGETLFFALKTANNDGHKYVDELYNLGVRHFVVQTIQPEWKNLKDINLLHVKDSLLALQKVATFHREHFNIPVIAITGSNGKTIVKEWIYQMLGSEKNITRSPRSYNSQLGVPLSVWQLNENTELGLFEAGISMPNEMTRLQKIIQPTIGVFTNIGDAHQENFKNLKQKCLEKLELFVNCDVIICEEGNKLLDECMEATCLSQKSFTWSYNNRSNSPLLILKVEKLEAKSFITYSFLGLPFTVELPFTDDASVENVTSSIAAALYLTTSIETIQEKVKQLEPVAMRLDVRRGKNNNIIVNDTYNSDINSLKIALSFLGQQSAEDSPKRTLILSDILQSGFSDEALYKSVSDLADSASIGRIIGIGHHISDQQKLFANIPHIFFDSTEDFISSGIWNEFHEETILLKGSRHFEFERISELIEQKNHETVLDINLDAILHNFKFHRSRMNPDTKIICMVKADAYGSGSEEVAKILQYHKCDYFAVAIAEEGVVLRKAGIKTPIIVLNPEVSGFNQLFESYLEPEVYNFRILDAFIKEAQRRGISDFPIHIKMDTGMHRLGFTEEDIPLLLERLKSQQALKVKSTFSHLAASESWAFDDFTTQQISLFKKLASALQDGLDYTIWRHILNSAGIERFPEEQMDMVRLGISLYGISASGLDGLRNVCTLKTTILQIKHLKKGETVGYGRRGDLDHDASIATIRIGYADGLSRQFGNRNGHVLVNGHLVPIIGNICMDLSMIEITGLDIKEGDEVILFGDELSVIDQAKKINTIPYEVLTSVSSRVRRIYFRE